MIYLGADHAGLQLKERIKQCLDKEGQSYVDIGATEAIPIDDYPDYAAQVAKKVLENGNNLGILVCGSGAGVCITANKFKGIRAAVAVKAEEIKKINEHTDINVLCLSGWKLSFTEAIKIVKTFLKTQFSGDERHVRRIGKIKKIEEENMR